MKQESFTPSDEQLMADILEFAEKEKRSKSEMIDLLLHQAVKERFRQRNKRAKGNIKHNTPDIHQNDSQ